MLFHNLFNIVQKDCTSCYLLCAHKLNKIVKRMGLLDFLFAGAVLNSMKKTRHNSSQPMHERATDYNHGYEEGYDDGCYDHSFHDDCDCHDTYDCDGYDDDCDNDCNW